MNTTYVVRIGKAFGISHNNSFLALKEAFGEDKINAACEKIKTGSYFPCEDHSDISLVYALNGEVIGDIRRYSIITE